MSMTARTETQVGGMTAYPIRPADLPVGGPVVRLDQRALHEHQVTVEQQLLDKNVLVQRDRCIMRPAESVEKADESRIAAFQTDEVDERLDDVPVCTLEVWPRGATLVRKSWQLHHSAVLEDLYVRLQKVQCCIEALAYSMMTMAYLLAYGCLIWRGRQTAGWERKVAKGI